MGLVGANVRTAWRVSDGVADLTRPRRARRPVAFAARPESLVIDANRAACVVIDMQNDFCAPDGWLASIGVDTTRLQRPIAPIARLLPRLREVGVPVIWVNWGNRPDRADLPAGVLHVYDHDGTGTGLGDPLPSTGARVLEHGSASAAVVDGLTIEPGDIAVDKTRMTGFTDTELDSVLRNLDISTVLYCGVNLDQCVFSTLIDGAALGYDAILLEDCCATTSPPATIEATLYNVSNCFGFVADSTDLISGLVGAPASVGAEVLRAASRLAYRISAGDTVKLVPIKTPTETFDASVFLEIWEPGGAQPPNSHEASVETFFVLEGTATAYSDDDAFTVGAGDFIVLPAGTVHRIENTGNGRVYAVTTMSPDAGFTQLVCSGVPEPLDDRDIHWAGSVGAPAAP